MCRPNETFGRWAWQDFVGWSPDGATILFSRGPELYGVTADGTRIWPVADAGTSTVLGEAGSTIPFDVSPDGRRMVYATCRYLKPSPPATLVPSRTPRLGYELALVSVDGTDPQRLTTNNLDFDSYPAWSPDGRRIAYLRGYSLQVMPIDGGTRVDVTFPVVEATRRAVQPLKQAPAWAPDGRQLAVAAGGGVFLVDADNGTVRQIAPNSQIAARMVGGPAWSPDGRRLAVLTSVDRDVTLATFDVNGHDVAWLASFDVWMRPEVDPALAWAPTVAWSPDGSKILVLPQPGRRGRAGSLAREGADVYVVTVTGAGLGQVTRIPARGHYAYAAAWAPDGSRLAVASMWDISQNDRRWGAAEPTRWGDVWVRTVAPDGRVLQVVAVRDPDGRLEAWHAPRPDNPDDLDACRTDGAVFDPASHPGLVDDCAALLALWARSEDSGYANWTTDRPLDEWDGVVLGGTPPRVRELRLTDGGLRGREARALRWLTELRRLELGGFGLSYIPRGLGQLEHLEELRLVGSGVPGRVPAELGHLANLRVLDLSGNQLTGSIPAELGQLPNLTLLDLSHNQLTGPIPEELAQLDGHVAVRLAGNALTGCVPPGVPVVDRPRLGLPDCEAGA